MTSTDNDLDFLNDIGLGDDMPEPLPATSEEVIYQALGGPKFDNMLYFIDKDIRMVLYLQNEKNVKMGINKLVNGQVINSPISVMELTKFFMQYYFEMLHLTRFIGPFNYEGKSYPPCDMATTIELFLARHEKLRKLANSPVDSFK